jgi:hypothetical protein
MFEGRPPVFCLSEKQQLLKENMMSFNLNPTPGNPVSGFIDRLMPFFVTALVALVVGGAAGIAVGSGTSTAAGSDLVGAPAPACLLALDAAEDTFVHAAVAFANLGQMVTLLSEGKYRAAIPLVEANKPVAADMGADRLAFDAAAKVCRGN